MMGKVLQCFHIDELIRLRKVNDRLAEKTIENVKKVTYSCKPDGMEKLKKSFLTKITKPSRIEIQSIRGNEDSLQQIQNLLSNITSKTKYLSIAFRNLE